MDERAHNAVVRVGAASLAVVLALWTAGCGRLSYLRAGADGGGATDRDGEIASSDGGWARDGAAAADGGIPGDGGETRDAGGASDGSVATPDGGGTVAGFEIWGRNQPDDETRGNCLAIALRDTGDNNDVRTWTDDACATVRPFVCELAAGGSVAGCVGAVATETRAYCAAGASHAAAAAACASAGGSLARVDGAAENDEIFMQARSALPSADRLWLGGDDETLEGDWRWPDGSRFPVDPFSNWGPGQPNDVGGVQSCATIVLADAAAGWDDIDCTTSKHFICDVPPGIDLPRCNELAIAGERRAYCQDDLTNASARATCASGGGTLVRFDSRAEHDAIVAQARIEFLSSEKPWTGADDLVVNGEWRWIDDGALFDAF